MSALLAMGGGLRGGMALAEAGDVEFRWRRACCLRGEGARRVCRPGSLRCRRYGCTPWCGRVMACRPGVFYLPSAALDRCAHSAHSARRCW